MHGVPLGMSKTALNILVARVHRVALVALLACGGCSRAVAQGPATFAVEPFTPEGAKLRVLETVEGAVVVTDDTRVGRVLGERIEWLPQELPRRLADKEQFEDRGGQLGDTQILEVHGRWPDRIDLVYILKNGSVPWPSYFPLTGTGRELGNAGSGTDSIRGVGTVGDSTLVAVDETFGTEHIETVRGPKLERRHLTEEQPPCKPGTLVVVQPPKPRLPHSRIAATREGTLVAFGMVGEQREPAAEVWRKDASTPHLVDLHTLAKAWAYDNDVPSTPLPVVSKGDELWVALGGSVLHYTGSAFEALPSFGDAKLVFASPDGELHATDGQVIVRYAQGTWTLVGRVTKPLPRLANMAFDGQSFWASTRPGEEGGAEAVYRLRKVPSSSP